MVFIPPREGGWDAICGATAIDIGRDPARFCDKPTPAKVAALTPGLVASAFARIPLPAATLHVQPPGGETLVNFDTNFYTEQGQLTRSLTLLGQHVDLRIWPSQFTWRYGDSTSETTAGPGAAYPDLQVTHAYRAAGGVSPAVDVTYAAQFSVDAGPWQDVSGTVTVPGEPVALRVREASPVLIGYD